MYERINLRLKGLDLATLRGVKRHDETSLRVHFISRKGKFCRSHATLW